MEDIKVRYCRLCFSDIKDEYYELIEDVTKEILSVLLLKLDFEEDSKSVMCNVCSSKLQAALQFKSTCLSTNNAINSYIDDATILPMDLKEIYMKERENVQLPDDIKICRLCMQPVKNVLEFKSIKKEQVDMMQEFVPEVNIFTIKEPVMCNLCQDSLATHFNFLKKCSYAEGDIGYISPFQDTPSQYVSVKLENVDMDYEDAKHSVGTEFLNIKNEEIKPDSEIQNQEICSQAEVYLKSNYEASGKPSLLEDKIELNHASVRKGPSQVQMYNCDNCDYATKYKGHLKTHKLIHKDPSEVRIYKCEMCNYKAKRNGHLRNHMLIHKDPSEVQMYKCEHCDYAAKHKGNFNKHMLSHTDSSEVKMYKCEDCNYATKHKDKLRCHALIHKDPSEVQMYKCENCSYATKRKDKLKTHTLVHKDISQVQMYKCEKCNYSAKYKGSIKSHMLIHKDPSEVQMYKCNLCDYATKHKGALKNHIIKMHEDHSQLQMYKCDN